MAMTRRCRTAVSRHDLSGAVLPPGRTLDQLPRSRRNVPVITVAVPDPGNPKERILASENRRVDILAMEHAAGRISLAAFNEGRIAQRLFEAALRFGSWGNWIGTDRVDASSAAERATIHRIDLARRFVNYEQWMRNRLGERDAQILRWVLGEGQSYSAVATAMTGQATKKWVSYTAQRFRHALEDLADAKAARGGRSSRKGNAPARPSL